MLNPNTLQKKIGELSSRIRVPIARLAAARAAVKDSLAPVKAKKAGKKK